VLLISSSASAGPVTWSFASVNLNTFFTGTVSGQFTYDADTNTYSAWSITVSNTAPGGVTLPIFDSGGNAIPLDGLLTPAMSTAVGAPDQLYLQASSGAILSHSCPKQV
jgi:hypothetical protein